jgi:hypothetical protein
VRSTQQQARIAGVWYLLLALSAPLGLIYVPGKLIVAGDASATADHIRAAPQLLRLGMAADLFHQVMAIFLVLALYRLFKPVDEARAKELVVLGALVSVPIMFANVLNDMAALMLAGAGDHVAAFTKPQLDALVYLFARLHGHGVMVTSIFWGLWLFPFGMLVMRSRFIPRLFGWLLLIAGAAYLVDALVWLLLPHAEALVAPVTGPLKLGELPIVLWLLIRGARPTAPQD